MSLGTGLRKQWPLIVPPQKQLRNNQTVLISIDHQPLLAHHEPVLFDKWDFKGKVVKLSHVVGKTTMFLIQFSYWTALYGVGRERIFFLHVLILFLDFPSSSFEVFKLSS